MDNKIIMLYCDTVIKPLEKRKKELEKDIYTKFFVSKSKKEELKLVQKLLGEKLNYLYNLMDKIEEDRV